MAIANVRIVGIANTEVAFRVWADVNGRKRTLRLSGSEFIARFLLHVLPAGFKRIDSGNGCAAPRPAWMQWKSLK